MPNRRQQMIRSLSVRYSRGHRIDWHAHDWSQLVYAIEGVMTVTLENGRWVVPPRRAIHVAEGQRHRIDMHGRVFMRTIYLKHSCRDWVQGIVVDVHSLMHELIQLVCERGIVRYDKEPDRTLVRFFEQQLATLGPVDMELKMPSEQRALGFAKRILANPAIDSPLDQIAKECGTSLRTLQRLFPQEVGLTVTQWRQRVKMLRAIECLGEGKTVTQVALDLGFSSVSGFIQVFRQYFGVTPGKYHRN